MKKLSTTLRIAPLAASLASAWLSFQGATTIMDELPAGFLSILLGGCIYMGMDIATREIGWSKLYGLAPGLFAFIISGVAVHSTLYQQHNKEAIAHNERVTTKWEEKEIQLIAAFNLSQQAAASQQSNSNTLIKESIEKIDDQIKRVRQEITSLTYQRKLMAKKYNTGTPTKSTKEQLDILDNKIEDKDKLLGNLIATRFDYVKSGNQQSTSSAYQAQPKPELKNIDSPFYLWGIAYIFDLTVWLSLLFARRYELLMKVEKETNVQKKDVQTIPEIEQEEVQTPCVHAHQPKQREVKENPVDVAIDKAMTEAKETLETINNQPGIEAKPIDKKAQLLEDLKNQVIEPNGKGQVIKSKVEKDRGMGRRQVESVFKEAVEMLYLIKNGNQYSYPNIVTQLQSVRG